MLRDASTYIFSCVSAMAETQDLRDESRRLCDVKPFCAVLKLIDWKEDEDNEKEINFQISSLLGKGKSEMKYQKAILAVILRLFFIIF